MLNAAPGEARVTFVMKLLHIQLGMVLALAMLLPEASAQS
jgi:hypothetical protein